MFSVFGSESVLFGLYNAYCFIFIQTHLFTKRCVGSVVFCKGLQREVSSSNHGLSIWSLYIFSCLKKKKKGWEGSY